MGTETLSGIDVMQDAEQMRGVFQAHLRPRDAAALEVLSCQIDYVRQSASRAVNRYTLQLKREATGEVHEQIVTAASFDGDRTEKLTRRLRRDLALANTALGPLALPPFTFAPSLGLLIQVYPFDFRLPGLLRLFQGDLNLIRPLLDDLGVEAGEIAAVQAETVRYRPDMRAMVRLEAQPAASANGHRSARRVYAKVYREDDEGRRAQRVLEVLWERTAAEDLGFAVARPIFYDPAWKTLVLSEVPGTRLLQIVRRHEGDDIVPAVRHAARAVAGFHQFSFPEGMLPESHQDGKDRLAKVAETLAANNPDCAGEVERIAEAIGATLARAPLSPTHFDLKLGHMMVGDDRVALLDFDKIALGDPLIDIANLVATLSAEREGGERRSERRLALADVFTDEYFAHVPVAWRERFPARLALAALAEAATTGRGNRGRTGKTDYAGRAASAVAHAQRVLDGSLR